MQLLKIEGFVMAFLIQNFWIRNSQESIYTQQIFGKQIVPLVKGNLTHGTKKMVPLNESSYYPEFHWSEEINKDFLKQIQETGGSGSTYQKFHLSVNREMSYPRSPKFLEVAKVLGG